MVYLPTLDTWVVLGDRCIGKWTSLEVISTQDLYVRRTSRRCVFSKPRWPSKVLKAKTLEKNTDMWRKKTHRIHGTVIFTYMKTIKIIHSNVGKYHSPMDPTGRQHFLQKTWLPKESWGVVGLDGNSLEKWSTLRTSGITGGHSDGRDDKKRVLSSLFLLLPVVDPKHRKGQINHVEWLCLYEYVVYQTKNKRIYIYIKIHRCDKLTGDSFPGIW